MPAADTDPASVYYAADEYGMIYGVFCPCGQYTVWGPLEWVERKEAERKQRLENPAKGLARQDSTSESA